ncbi:purine-uracil permease NCS1-like [Typha angustifolia]|uniref:purine-uracil permease NCS1-like n=1 Tax=Typha angustifolia TaxID=59011 RepID=UPI003C2D5C23
MTNASSAPSLRPTTPSQRTATASEFASLWVGLVVGVPSYYIAGSLVESGMSWYQALLTIVSSKCFLLLPLLAASHPGARYGLTFPLLARAAFGLRGAHVPALLRALVACGWFGIESWIGGRALLLLLPSSLHVSVPIQFASFALFILAQILLAFKGMQAIRTLERYSAPVLILLAFLLLSWAYLKAGGFGPMLSLPSRLTPSEFWALFFPSLTANVGSWAAFALTIADFTRYARSQADQVLGQMGLPLFMGCFAFVGLSVTSATVLIFGRPISDPIQLLSLIGGGIFVKLLAVGGITLAILTTNIPANVVAPANALVNLAPSVFSFKSGAVFIAIVGIAFQPWKIYATPDSFVYTWLVGYSAVMGPIAGVMLVDYYVIRGTELVVEALYSTSPLGPYYYTRGFNLVAFVSMAISLGPIIPGFLHKMGIVTAIPGILVFIYNVGWFFGFFSSGIVYWVLSCLCEGCWKRKMNKAANLMDPLLS